MVKKILNDKHFLVGLLLVHGCLSCFAATTEDEIFGKPDWRPPACWQLPKVCGKDFWTILPYPGTYDSSASFAPGDEPAKFTLFQEGESGYYTGSLKSYVEHRAGKPGVPCYSTGIRYAVGLHFVPQELGVGFTEAGPRLRKNKETAEPFYAIDGNLGTGWAFPKIMPQWLICKLPEMTTIDRIRFVPYWPPKPVWKFLVEVSSNGKTWTMVADKRQNTEAITSEAGMDLKFSPVETKLVRLTFTGLDDRNSSVMEVAAYRGTTKIPFTSAEASDSIYDDLLRTPKETQALARKIGDCFLGFSTEEWGNDLGHLGAFWAGNTKIFNQITTAATVNIGQYVPKKPDSATEYLSFLRNESQRLTELDGGRKFMLDSHFQMLSYEAEWGTPVVAMEFAPNTYGTSFSLGWDFLRGAARQYNRPIMSYLVAGIEEGRGSYPLGQTSLTIPFEKRWYWFNYLSGATFVDPREDLNFYNRDANRIQKLSQLGRMKVEWYEQIKKHPDRGVRATPIAIAFDYAHLLTCDMSFAQDGPDAETVKALNGIVSTGIYSVRNQVKEYSDHATDQEWHDTFRGEAGQLYNRSFGEVFDWVMLNAPSGAGEKALQNYRAVYLLGRLDATPSLTEALRSFLVRGGLVIAQATHALLIPEEFRAISVKSVIDDSEEIHDGFTGRDYVMSAYQAEVDKAQKLKGAYRLTLVETSQPVYKIYRDKLNRPVVLWSQAGKGGVFWVLGDTPQTYTLFPVIPDLLKRIADHALPVRVTGDIQWLANKTADGWVIGLLNNHGVLVKPADSYHEFIDTSDEKSITIEYPGKIEKIREWLTDVKLTVKQDGTKSFLSVTVPAGDVRIVQFRTVGNK